MSRRRLVNRFVFDLGIIQPVGRVLYAKARQRETPEQSTATKFFRNQAQLAALDGPLADIVAADRLRVLVAGCSMGCEALSLAGHLALSRPHLDFHIDACDISDEALAVARSGTYGSEHGLGMLQTARERDLEDRLFERRGARWHVVGDIRERISFAAGDVLSPQFAAKRDYDLVFGQNFLIHMRPADAARAFAALVAAVRPGGALFVGGMDLDQRPALVAEHRLEPVEWNIEAIHDADDMRRSAWPWHYWALEPIDRRAVPFAARYATIFRKPLVEKVNT